ncbi:hypothetical protein EG68_00894 [Paragonimus skrjabini miyazakii]|uniref:Uncharacterized protein n=1 Tax=Paragonimus skrjabini miyazakii TaxID=59628 RepID=A0A8S9Z581_9TREM|nr:hypothetical protein EG68_00894 [Paragonimus skrjabini miyazakii]
MTKETRHQPEITSKPTLPCWYYKEWHYARLSPVINHICNKDKELCCHALVQPSQRQGNFHRPPKFASGKSKAVITTLKIDGESKHKYVALCINDVPTRLQLDAASDITLISRDTWRKLGWPPLFPTQHTARNAWGETLKLAGEVISEVKFGDSRIKTCCLVTNHPSLDLLGLDWMDDVK